MKKSLSLLICILLAGALLAQEKYPIPELSSDQKHSRAVSQAWVMAASGVQFAKTHGVSPYEYGKYLGNLFAPSWGDGNDFDQFVKGCVFNYESFRDVTDAPLQVKENPDGSVTVLTSENMWHKYFPEGNPFASYREFLDLVKGLNEPIASHMGATVTLESKDNQLIFNFRKK